MQRILLVVAFGVVCVGLITWSSTSAQAPQPIEQSKWEYRAFFNGGPPQDGHLNNLGREGWELVTVTQFEHDQSVAYFKRPKR